MEMVNAITTADFQSAVLDAPTPVLVDFWAPWCGPCRAVGPVLDELAGQFADRVSIVKVNVDEEPELAARFGVRSIPTLLIFDQGELAQTLVGAHPKAPLAAALEKQLGARAA
ncbi:MAG: thioredoxin [Gammaproteobacteria bacterium]